MIGSVQTVPLKTNHTATSTIMFSCFAMLVSCSSGQNAFFAESDALISQGYKWKKLDKCRPATKDTPVMPITVSDGRKLVCYTLVPPQAGATAASLPVADDSQTAISNPTAATITPAITPGTSPATTLAATPALPVDQPADRSVIIWNFSNF